jgi:hypothetical protein
LYSRFHPDDVADVVSKPLIQADEEIDGAKWFSRHGRKPALEPGSQRFGFKKRSQLASQRVVVEKGTFLRIRLEKEIEGIEHRHFGDEIDLH